jgi:hypothetical protein
MHAGNNSIVILRRFAQRNAPFASPFDVILGTTLKSGERFRAAGFSASATSQVPTPSRSQLAVRRWVPGHREDYETLRPLISESRCSQLCANYLQGLEEQPSSVVATTSNRTASLGLADAMWDGGDNSPTSVCAITSRTSRLCTNNGGQCHRLASCEHEGVDCTDGSPWSTASREQVEAARSLSGASEANEFSSPTPSTPGSPSGWSSHGLCRVVLLPLPASYTVYRQWSDRCACTFYSVRTRSVVFSVTEPLTSSDLESRVDRRLRHAPDNIPPIRRHDKSPTGPAGYHRGCSTSHQRLPTTQN